MERHPFVWKFQKSCNCGSSMAHICTQVLLAMRKWIFILVSMADDVTRSRSICTITIISKGHPILHAITYVGIIWGEPKRAPHKSHHHVRKKSLYLSLYVCMYVCVCSDTSSTCSSHTCIPRVKIFSVDDHVLTQNVAHQTTEERLFEAQADLD